MTIICFRGCLTFHGHGSLPHEKILPHQSSDFECCSWSSLLEVGRILLLCRHRRRAECRRGRVADLMVKDTAEGRNEHCYGRRVRAGDFGREVTGEPMFPPNLSYASTDSNVVDRELISNFNFKMFPPNRSVFFPPNIFPSPRGRRRATHHAPATAIFSSTR